MHHTMRFAPLALTILCSGAFGRIGQEGLSEADETLLAYEAVSEALGGQSRLRQSAPALMAAIDGAMRLTEDGVAYDAGLTATLAEKLAALCGGEFDETGATAREFGLRGADLPTVEIISGPLFAVVDVLAKYGPHREHRRAA